MQQSGFGDFHVQPKAADRAACGRGMKVLDEGASPDLLRRHVDGDAHRFESEAAPMQAVLDGRLQHPVAHGNDQAGGFEHVEKSRRQRQTVLRIVPSQESLDSLDPPGSDVHLRLVVHDELLFVQSNAQLVFQREPFRDVAVHLDLIVQILLAGLLRLLQRRLRPLDQGVAVRPVHREERQSGFEGSPDGAPFDVEDVAKDGAFQQRSDTVRGRFDLRQNHGEGSSTQVADALIVVDVMLEAVRDPLQQQVADVTPETVVDVAEVHDIESHHRRRAFRTGTILQR